MKICEDTYFEAKNQKTQKNEEVPRRELEKHRRNMLSDFGFVGSKIEALGKMDDRPVELSKNPLKICDKILDLVHKFRVSNKNVLA